MLGGDGLGDVLEIRHGDGAAFEVRQARVNWDDVAELSAGRELACGSVTCVEDDDTVLALHQSGIGELIPYRERIFPRVASPFSKVKTWSGLKLYF